MAEVQRSEDILSSDLVDVPTGASAASDVAAVSYSLDADIERFFVDLTIAESNYTPSATLEEVLDERRQRDERRDRIKQRAEEMMQGALKNEEHASDVRQLSEAVDSLGSERPAEEAARLGVDAAARGAGALGEAAELQLDVSYPAFGASEGAQPAGAHGKVAELRREAEVLRAYFRHGAHAADYAALIERARAELGDAHPPPEDELGLGLDALEPEEVAPVIERAPGE